MKLHIKGTPKNVNEILVLKVTRYRNKLNDSSYCLLIDDFSDYNGDSIAITTREEQLTCSKQIYVKTLDHLSEDDIVSIDKRGNIRTLYRVNSRQNSLFVTERCNSNCLMCSQPPKDIDDIMHHHNIHKKLIPLIPKSCKELGITGGEPTILGDLFIELLSILKNELPQTEIHVLTNGRSFAINALAQKISEVNHPRIMFGIPLYSDYYQIHDYVVQSKDAYYQTLMGISNLKRYGIRVELRMVLHEITISRLENYSKFIYKNLPFVDHVAFMGLEIMGFTKANLDKLWIEPSEYIIPLEKAVLYLASKKINVSIYNTPLCLLPFTLWEFAVKSISDWKNIYFDECEKCAVKVQCGGFFKSAESKRSNQIKAFDTVPVFL
ncbi:His-Xaa-Ser system radical SAM maturase HxsC [Tamlana sp. s12]|uniref:His-Xaa-Ser system radical SAM maturase HxsC n=1 Tax=Tamlana sp. s12 TaxID=1630406 RepID=UPI0007FCE31D|nr:His-Xaa-Ser system radical SAM maturase HxsC [Tamlana sp. s12]OBQ56925.1 radical SAM protein [Tamlana sp. s12]QQY82901.1 His-Xaa-Ser system radical SAM maturase HxsC [Tamlana sp. s12]